MELNERLVCFAAETLILMNQKEFSHLPETMRIQLIKSSSSPGANYEEAQTASSRSDFHQKCKISLRELRETNYWLRVIIKTGMGDERLNKLLKESIELIKIFVTICKKTDPQFKK